MNERIQELVKQAGGIGHDDDGNELTPALVGKGLEKFAELIVRECAKFMDENSGYNDSDGCWFPEPEDMLKHFGVEE